MEDGLIQVYNNKWKFTFTNKINRKTVIPGYISM